MGISLEGYNEWVWSSFADALTPLPKDSEEYRTLHAARAIVFLPLGLVTGTLVGFTRIALYAVSFFQSSVKETDPEKDFSVVLEDSRLWTRLGKIEDKITLGLDDPNFLFGVATSTYQDSGAANCPDSQWVEHEKTILSPENGSGRSANLFGLYKTAEGRQQITDRLHQTGVNLFRFSIEWSQIEPIQGTFHEANLQVYIDFCKHLRDEGIQPMVTLHHFSEPAWFHAKGSFEKDANIRYFINFCQHVFPFFTQLYKGRPLVEYFCTINEPNVEMFCRYIRPAYSPAGLMEWDRAGNFLKGMLKAHFFAYEILKKMAPPSVQIGVTQQYMKFIPYNFLSYPVTTFLTHLVNDVMLNFFRSGVFDYRVPLSSHVYEDGLKPRADFVGVQFYARPVVGGWKGSTSFHEPMTMMPYREDPEGLYEAVVECHKAFKAPVIVTESGISTRDPDQRARYISRALYATQRAQDVIGKENMRGYTYWSLTDNFEWDMGYDQEFGAYALTQVGEERLINPDYKPGFEAYVKVAKLWQETHSVAAGVA